jgi:hypothetical protein
MHADQHASWLKGYGVYKGHRIHLSRLHSGSWLISLVRLGVSQAAAAGAPVENVRGQYASEEDAVSAARAYIDGGDAALDLPVLYGSAP